jgi:hypothetical protein
VGGLLRCMSLLLALFGHGAMSELSPLSEVERKSDIGAVRSVDDPEGDIQRGRVESLLLCVRVR